MAFPHRLVLHRPVMRHDQRLGHGFVPNVRVRICHERGSYVLRTNAQGYRSNVDYGAKGERPRVVVYGDSFAAGDGVANEERFTDRIAAALDVEVVNLAVSGTAPDQNVLLAETQPDEARDADLVLWCVATHTIDRIRLRHRTTFDAEGTLSRVARPYFEWEGNRLVARGVPVPDARETIEPDVVAGLELGARRALRTAREHVRDAVLEPMRALCRTTLGPPQDPRFVDPESDAWRMMIALTRRFRTAVGAAPIVIVPLPNRHHVEGRLAPTYRPRFASLPQAAGLDRDQVEVWDVFPAIAARSAERRRELCFPFDGHYTPAGHGAIADAIVAQGLAARLPAASAGARARTDCCASSCRTSGAGSESYRLEVAWDHAGSRARLVDVRDDRVVAAEEEADVAGRLGMIGAVPFTAINVCLDRAGIDDGQLAEVVLVSPAHATVLHGGAEGDRRGDRDWARWAAPWIRWIGAAEIDVRRQLSFDGPIVERERRSETQRPALPEGGGEPACEEEAWLFGELERRRAAIRRDGSLRVVRSLGSKWERVTRRARYAPLPFPAPSSRRIRTTRRTPLRR